MFQATFDTENAAFGDDTFRQECARILEDIADRIKVGATNGKIMDSNGNRVGKWSLS